MPEEVFGNSVFQVKAIKPQRLKVDAIRLELLNALRAEGRATEADYRKCVSTWSNPPKFSSTISLAGGNAAVLTAPDGTPEQNQIFDWVDRGTRKGYRIPKAGFRRLSYRSYNPKTQPGVIGSGAGEYVGDYRHAMWVTHPGITARMFSQTIQKNRVRRFKRAMEEAMKRGAAKAAGR